MGASGRCVDFTFSRGWTLLVQEQQVVDDVGILLGDLGIGAVIHQSLDGTLDGGAQLLIIGAEGDAGKAATSNPLPIWPVRS